VDAPLQGARSLSAISSSVPPRCTVPARAHSRALQGIGAAFLVPGSLAIITTTFDDEERGRAIGTWSGFTAIMTAVGPVLGGWLVEHASWRAVFFMNVPLAGFGAAMDALLKTGH